MKRLRRWRRNCLILLTLLAFLCLGLCLALAFLVGRAEAQWIELPLDVLLLIDHSNSMWDGGSAGSDPDLLRIRAAQLLMAYLGTAEVPAGHRLGMIHFGGQAELVAPPTPLDEAGREALRTAIADPPRMGATDPLAALSLAYETLFPQGERDSARQPVVILLTDGQPKPGNLSREEMDAYLDNLRSLADRFREQSCSIFTIALSNEAIAPDPPLPTRYRNLWQEIAARTPPATYHEADTADDLLPVCHTIVAQLSGAEADAPIVETTVTDALSETIHVEASLAHLTLVALHDDPALAMGLLRPGGAHARPSDPDVRQTGDPEDGVSIWTIDDPRAGPWTLSLRGRGSVLAWMDVVPRSREQEDVYRIEVGHLPARVPGDDPVIVDVYLKMNDAGEIITSPTLRVVGEVRRAGLAEVTHLARDDGRGCDAAPDDGRHCLGLSDLPPGACTLLLRALLDGDEVVRRELAFVVEPPPTPTLLPTPSPILTPTPAIVASSQQPTTRRIAWPWLLGGLAVLAGLGGGGWLMLRHYQRPPLSGSLRVLAAPSDEQTGRVIDLPAQPSVVVGPPKKRAIPLPGTTVPFKLSAVRGSDGEVETWIAPLSDQDGERLTLDDRPVHAARRLRDGHVLTLGTYRLRYEDLRQASRRRAQHRPRRRAFTR
jgi:Mg-chelatase subunit ChlD